MHDLVGNCELGCIHIEDNKHQSKQLKSRGYCERMHRVVVQGVEKQSPIHHHSQVKWNLILPSSFEKLSCLLGVRVATVNSHNTVKNWNKGVYDEEDDVGVVGQIMDSESHYNDESEQVVWETVKEETVSPKDIHRVVGQFLGNLFSKLL